MPLFWIVHTIEGAPRVTLQAADTKLYARLQAEIAGGIGGTFAEIHALDAATAKKVPKAMTGRLLTPREVETLLARFAANAKRPAAGARGTGGGRVIPKSGHRFSDKITRKKRVGRQTDAKSKAGSAPRR